MHVERVRFDRVFDVRERLEEFSFEDGGRPVYGVRALGLGIPREGAIYAVVFLEPGNWETVVGWRDLTTARVELRRSNWTVITHAMPFWMPLAPGVIAVSNDPGGSKVFVTLAGAVMLASIVHGARGLLRNRRAGRALRDAACFTTTEIMA
ncbi:hypothetical protein [Telluria beijingensis]|uniref:hypothetical protein n=1 Tax=Telluria beijingensis TaxID=3068633 RepID=UPI0027956CD7|nr:hypothetical protein [Massilia sp. REN29]